MYEEPESYGIAYRMIKRMRRLEAIVLEKFSQQVERDMYGCWIVKKVGE
jgi:hypothetical protein